MARGPGYPFVDLGKAIELARKFYAYSKRSPALADSVAKDAWSYSPTSSSAIKAVAALKYFGLADEIANGDSKSIKLTDRAYRIIIDNEQSAERKQALVDAALSPKWYRFSWNKWGKEMPPSMRSTLIFEHQFVDSTVDSFLKDYKSSIALAGLLSGASNEDKLKGGENGKTDNTIYAKVGDYVQWESAGALQFKAARRIIGLSDDGSYAFVEGSSTGIPIKELTVVDPPEAQPKLPPAAPTARQMQEEKSMRQDVFSLLEGTVTIQWPSSLSPESLQDIKDWLKILERKITRSVSKPSNDSDVEQV